MLMLLFGGVVNVCGFGYPVAQGFWGWCLVVSDCLLSWWYLFWWGHLCVGLAVGSLLGSCCCFEVAVFVVVRNVAAG